MARPLPVREPIEALARDPRLLDGPTLGAGKMADVNEPGMLKLLRTSSLFRARMGGDAMATLRSKAVDLAWVIASFGTFFLLWEALSTWVFNPKVVPGPAHVLQLGWAQLLEGRLTVDTEASLGRVVVGLALGSSVGIVLGLVIGRVLLAERLLEPLVHALRTLTPTALIPIAVVWFGIGEASKYFLIYWGTVFFVTINTTAGVKSSPVARIRAAMCLGASRQSIFFLIILPSAIPQILVGIRLGVASAFMSIVPAELLAATHGLGAALAQAAAYNRVDEMFVVLTVIGFLGFFFDWVVQFVGRTILGRYTAYVTAL